MPLKVLQIASSFPRWGGTEIHILNLSEQLRLRGHSVTIACQPGRWVEGRARELGIPTTPVTVDRLHDRKDMPALRRFLRDNKVDVLHAHWSQDMIIPPVSAMLEHVPVRILSRHLPNSLKNRAGGWIYSNILFSRVVTVSESVRQTLLTSGMSPGRVDTIHHGTDIVVFGATTQSVSERRSAFPMARLRSALWAVSLARRVTNIFSRRYDYWETVIPCAASSSARDRTMRNCKRWFRSWASKIK
jgi:glycosyltransferase involved in cell wall biosynthesis